ncbi:hypothetical protein [Spongiactinospora sp. TRM90649]|uniref:hypothetical protein n=1 Tax=Spongiactinospora sp. TRM90649 TaxID=3031114 RepID=UPI0023F87CE0|nr:hypothetical protein [Spongiactinospora sp. TRM90649]MDF5753809.1 hypothetical protein [Spongiactinospora sp. TRM90649]
MSTREITRTAPGEAGDALRALIDCFSGHDSAGMVGRLVEAAAAVAGTRYAGLIEVEPADERAFRVLERTPPGDPQRVGRWLTGSGVLRTLATGSDPIRLPRDPSAYAPGFLAVPIPLSTRRQAYLWVAGRGFDDADEHLLVRLAWAAGTALEAACGLETATRALRSVHAFCPPSRTRS